VLVHAGEDSVGGDEMLEDTDCTAASKASSTLMRPLNASLKIFPSPGDGARRDIPGPMVAFDGRDVPL